MRVVILGCGPAGLASAHAAAMSGADVRILSRRRKSFMKGAQYLHSYIPFATLAGSSFPIEYTLRGSPEQYRLKVYGKAWDGTVSPEDLETTHTGWPIVETYDALWEMYGSYVEEWNATPAMLNRSLSQLEPDLCVSSIPAPLLCSEGHTFGHTTVYSTDRALLSGLSDNQVVCNGEDAPSWYRCSRIQGFENTEWPGSVRPPVTPLWEVTKPTKNNCDCFPGVLRVGRYGRWEKGVLSDSAFGETAEKIVSIALPGDNG